ncbi:MAG: integrase arm-type DNA-binding domain-containing protein [Achromobacter sp.]|uniref:tyrosine-type recombinase/integrase n=1 Tax=Achromobacter sp. TaxID=134375 RepID=UPI00258EB823|nr:integrase arm-type DNA-binding domain-containing protein [Achromobacter sp.]MCW0207284.1 integrase arm-type DNA-binding domain-containing protein [Achromobacter sp.]
MPLSDTAIRKAKPADKTQRLFDGGGLYLEITPAGGKLWRQKYRFGGKEKRLAHGTYPEVSLAEARDRRDNARKLLAAGTDPGEHRKAEKQAGEDRAANSFEAVAREWFGKFAPNWAASHAGKIMGRLENDLFPWIGSRPVAEIKAPELLRCLRRIESRGALETAHRVLQNAGQVFRYAIATGRADRDPSTDLRGALAPWKPQHYPAPTDPKAVGELLRAIDGYTGGNVVKAMLRLAPLVFVRPGELRQAEWAEIDLEAAEWNIPAHKMKMREPHMVPLSRQAIEILTDLQPLTGNRAHVFPGGHDPRKPMSEAALNAALRRIGYDGEEMTAHGFRAIARTLLDEELGFRPDYIEHQLAHAVRDPNGRAYNRTAHLAARRKMMQAWADYLDRRRTDTGKILEFKKSGSRR